MTSPRLLVSLPVGTHLHGGNPRGLVDLSKRAEDAGVDGVVIADHVSMGKHVDRYPWGKFPFAPDAPWLEPLTVLTAIAMATERIKLTTGILIVPLRPAALLAKTVATLDVLSGGRVELGVGTGWQAEELLAQGIDPADRGQILTDSIGACRALWRSSPASFESPSVTFEDIWSEPKPVRAGGPPILFSGTLNARNMHRIVELGDGWIPIMGEPLDGVAEGIQRLRDDYIAAGRAPEDLIVRAPVPIRKDGDGSPSLAATLERTDELAAIGITDLNLTITVFAKDDEGAARFFDEIASRWVATR